MKVVFPIEVIVFICDTVLSSDNCMCSLYCMF